MAPFGQIWYFRLMEKLIPGAPTMEIALKKVLADQIVAGPVFISFFLFGKELLEGRGGSVGITELKDKFLPLYMASWCVWPPAQLLLFKFLPAERRFRYLAGLTFCWNFFLSWYTHKLSKLKQHKVLQNMFYVNVLTTGGLLAAGDVITQQVEMAMDEDRTQRFNPKRTERMFLIGLCLGPFGHLWYTKFVEKLVPGAPSTTTALKKILADQIIAGPFFCSAFFFGKYKLQKEN
uniref:Mpv17-like protein 2 n=1 Tax=Magallana gigas TaxID=29159 RepID=K1S0D5_MAGGI